MKKFDVIMRTYLAPEIQPDQYLNDKILGRLDEKGHTNMKRKFNLKKACLTAAAICCCVLPAYAAIKFLSPSQVAAETGKNAVAQAFESDDAIPVNETQIFEDYSVTFLGLVSGKALEDKIVLDDSGIENDRTYFVTAVAKTDGSGFESVQTAPTFCVSPFIKGYNPTLMNVMTLKGNYEDIMIDGIVYRLMDCTNIECFADTTVYLGVTVGELLPEWSAFNYDDSTGVITRDTRYSGVNALFEIPFGISKADNRKAEKIINSAMGK